MAKFKLCKSCRRVEGITTGNLCDKCYKNYLKYCESCVPSDIPYPKLPFEVPALNTNEICSVVKLNEEYFYLDGISISLLKELQSRLDDPEDYGFLNGDVLVYRISEFLKGDINNISKAPGLLTIGKFQELTEKEIVNIKHADLCNAPLCGNKGSLQDLVDTLFDNKDIIRLPINITYSAIELLLDLLTDNRKPVNVEEEKSLIDVLSRVVKVEKDLHKDGEIIISKLDNIESKKNKVDLETVLSR